MEYKSYFYSTSHDLSKSFILFSGLSRIHRDGRVARKRWPNGEDVGNPNGESLIMTQEKIVI